MIAYHCDTEGCDSWQRSEADNLVFHTLIDPDENETHFCSLNCVMLWAAAHSSPTETHELKWDEP